MTQRLFALLAVFALVLAGPLAVRAETADDPIAWATDQLDAYYRTLFAVQGLDYTSPTVTIIPEDGTAYTGCGTASDPTVAFYCSLDGGIYMAHEFVAEMAEADDFLPLFVLAHEWSHHVQTLTGARPTLAPISGDWNQVLVIEQELRADCMAGAWSASLAARGLLDASDMSAVFVFANEAGDPPLALILYGRNAGHGNGEERVRAIFTGYESGIVGCAAITPLEREVDPMVHP